MSVASGITLTVGLRPLRPAECSPVIQTAELRGQPREKLRAGLKLCTSIRG